MAKYAGRSLVVSYEGDTLGQLKSFSEYGSERNLIDASVYGEDWTDFVTGLQDGTVVNGVVVLDPTDTGATAIQTDFENNPDDVVTFTATHEGSSDTKDITGRLTKVAFESPLDGLYQMNFSFKIVNPGVVAGT